MRAQGRTGAPGLTLNLLRRWACPGAELSGRPQARSHFPTSHGVGRLSSPSGWACLGFPCRNQRPPHSGIQGHFLGGLLGGRCGCRTWERSLRTPTCRRGHRQYLRSGPPYDFPRYRSKVHEVTQAFAAVSREMLAVEAELAGPRAQPLLAGHVRSLQQLEQTRLATVRTRPRSLFPTPKPGLYRGGLLGPLCAFGPNGHIPVPHNPVPGAPGPTSNYPTSVFH